MPFLAGLYVWSVALCGAAAAAWAVSHWHSHDLIRFGAYLALACFASGLKVHLRQVTGTLSGSFFIVLLAAVDLQLSEAVLVGIASMLVQVFWHSTRRVEFRHAAFNVGNAVLSAGSAWLIYHAVAAQPALRPLQIAAAALIYFLVNTWVVSIVIGLTERRPVFRTWTENYLFSFPPYLLATALVGGYDYADGAVGWQLAILFVPACYAVYDSYCLHVERVEQERRHEAERRIHAEELSALHVRTIEALASSIEAKDHTTHSHLRRVQVFAVEIGRELGLEADQIEALRAAAVLHDIGKIQVPEHIINKPGRLTATEFDKMKLHPIVGAQMLARVGFPYPVAPIVRSHHERWDGTGYPDGLRGEQIPIGARILAAVDCLDALSTDRQYRLALPPGDAMAVVSAQAGRAFDPRIYLGAARGISVPRQQNSPNQL